MKECTRKRDNCKVFRWQVQRDLCCVSSCSAMANIHKHPFSWRETLSVSSSELVLTFLC